MNPDPPPFHALEVDAALAEMATPRRGLDASEAEARLARDGPNVLKAARPRSAWKILLDQLRSLVVLLLFVAAAIAIASGDRLEAIAIAAVLVLNTLLGFVTEIRARRAMEALLRLEAPRAVVLRGGETLEIAARDVVTGDLVRLEPGQSIPADARVIEATDLRVEEAALTGESMPVQKSPQPVPIDAPLPDRTSMVYKGTAVAAGAALALVIGTGMRTELGRIGELVERIPEERTPLERRLDALGRRLVLLVLAVAAVVVGMGLLQGSPLALMLETGIALAIAAVPEGLPAVATIALAVGVRRMARRRALVRRLPSVETLGSVTVICTDKTGTLTAGEMTATTLWLDRRELRISGAGYAAEGEFLHDGRRVDPREDPIGDVALRIAVLANRAGLEPGPHGARARGDPTEAALLVAARKAAVDREAIVDAWPEQGEVPFSSERALMATFNRGPDGALVAHVKGAPGRILDCCDRVLTRDGERPLDPERRREIESRNATMAGHGQRVLALALGPVAEASEAALHGLVFVALVGLADPPAPGVRETIRTLRGAGIRTAMITGDQAATAAAIALDLGLSEPDDEVLGARELQRLGEEALSRRIGRVAVFSRVSPEQKLAIVSAYQRRGDIVAMLGDGVNDAAALKKADVGVAMGIRGTDVAKEAAAIVLQDDRFRTIAAAVEEGRVIFDNIRKFVFYLFSCNLAEVLVLLGAGLAGLPLPLTPLQILWLNLVTDTFPALALALEPAEPDVMRRPPRRPDAAILSAGFLRAIAFYAGLITAATLLAFWLAVAGPLADPSRALTVSFITLALAQAFHLGNARSHGAVLGRGALSNRYALGAVALVLLLQLLALYAPPLTAVLDTRPLRWQEWLIVLPLSALPGLVGQAVRVWTGRRRGG